MQTQETESGGYFLLNQVLMKDSCPIHSPSKKCSTSLLKKKSALVVIVTVFVSQLANNELIVRQSLKHTILITHAFKCKTLSFQNFDLKLKITCLTLKI